MIHGQRSILKEMSSCILKKQQQQKHLKTYVIIMVENITLISFLPFR